MFDSMIKSNLKYSRKYAADVKCRLHFQDKKHWHDVFVLKISVNPYPVNVVCIKCTPEFIYHGIKNYAPRSDCP